MLSLISAEVLECPDSAKGRKLLGLAYSVGRRSPLETVVIFAPLVNVQPRQQLSNNNSAELTRVFCRPRTLRAKL